MEGEGTMPTDDELFTPAEVLGGFSAKRARLLLFQIESRTAHLMLQSRRTVDLYLTEEIAEQQDLAFFEALAAGRDLPVRPTIRGPERYAPQWQSLVPPNSTLQATLAHLLAQKYRFAQRDIPHIKSALALESEGVQQAFQRQYQQSLDMIYSRRVDLLEWAGWQWNKLSAWLEHLPPFWTAYALTFTQIVGASILALPIALAGLGPLPGVVILVVIGLINVLTIAAMAEAQRVDPLSGQLPGSAGAGLSGKKRFHAAHLDGRAVLCSGADRPIFWVRAYSGRGDTGAGRSLGRSPVPDWIVFCASEHVACYGHKRPGCRGDLHEFDTNPLWACFEPPSTGVPAVRPCSILERRVFRTGPVGLDLWRGV